MVEDQEPKDTGGSSGSKDGIKPPDEEPEEEQDEAQEAKVRRAPMGPTKQEREAHEATHMPFREWCKYCVRGRGRNRPHKKKSKMEKGEIPTVSKVAMDYFFMSQDDERADRNPRI